uniref:Phage regulatory protein CII (CP76) n=1 Tax=Candidatus Kentrum sp. LFY TaxID=2126342 RepID=A0A450WBZ7_9GAMM|nr:MAG: Phage regulatory protein CII (CP76) [Candidatus Kentron sp. LFY]
MEELDLAIYETAKNYDGGKGERGIAALGRAIDAHSGLFQNKVNPSLPDHRLTLKEARAMMLVTGDLRILSVLAGELGHGIFPIPKTDCPADMDLMEAWANWQAEVAETVQKLRDSLQDGRITQEEIAQIKRELLEDFGKGMSMVKVLEGMAEPE